MVNYLVLEEMVDASLRGARLNGSALFVFDTCAHKYRFAPTNYDVAVCSGVLDELNRLPEVFPEQHIYTLAMTLDPKIVKNFVSKRHEGIVLGASFRSSKSGRISPGIGWVDQQQIGYGLQRAEKNRHTVLVSDDGDILNVVRDVRERYEVYNKYLHSLSLREYIRARHSESLRGLRGRFKHELFKEILGLYRFVA